MKRSPHKIHRGELWHVLKDLPPSWNGRDASEFFEVLPDGAVVVSSEGMILEVGDSSVVLDRYPGLPVTDHRPMLLLPGLVDAHLHFPQLDMIGSHGSDLLGWLNTYTFPFEERFADQELAQETAHRFWLELLANGVTTAAVFSSSHLGATQQLFSSGQKAGMRAIIGKVTMDRQGPASLLAEAQQERQAIEALIREWHGRDNRLFVALTPRFAPSCSDAMLAAMGAIRRQYPDVYVQTHLAESQDELKLVKSLFPSARHYLGVYGDAGLLGPKTILAHCIHLSDLEVGELKASGASVAHCPTSNLFLGSGIMGFHSIRTQGIPLGLGSDVGAGTSLSPWRTMSASYGVQALRGERVSPLELFHAATLGGAAALGFASVTGNFAVGKSADFQVLDLDASRLLSARRDLVLPESGSPPIDHLVSSRLELLSALIALGDDRLVDQVYVCGELRYRKL